MELLLQERNVRIRKIGKAKGVTSEGWGEIRSVGMSLEAGVTLAILGLSLVKSFRMGEERRDKQEKG
jgi:hypothetical protein